MTQTKSFIERVLESPIFAALGKPERDDLLSRCKIEHARAGESLSVTGELYADYIVVLSGELKVSRASVDAGVGGETRLGAMRFEQGVGAGGVLYTGSRADIAALTDTDFIRIDGDILDEMLAASQQFPDSVYPYDVRTRMAIARSARSLRSLPLHEFAAVYQRFTRRPAASGEIIVTQGEKGDNYYLIESGRAEVWRIDPISDETFLAAELGPGDAFGEEAVILDGFRNATVKMVTSGVLLVLDQNTFKSVIKANHVTEVSAEEAVKEVDANRAHWLDCRYEMEYDEARIPGAKLVELDKIRDACVSLDKSQTYIVYCRSGRRSACAAFLLRERGINAVSLEGGLRDWPFALETSY